MYPEVLLLANKKKKKPKFGVSVPFPQTSFIICALSVVCSFIMFAWALKDPAVFMPAVIYSVLVSLSIYLAWITTSSKAHGLNPTVQTVYCLLLSIIGIVIHIFIMAKHPVVSVLQPFQYKPEHKENIVRNYFASIYTGFATLINLTVLIMIIVLGS